MNPPFLWLATLACASAAALGLLPLSRRARLAGLTAGVFVAPLLIFADGWDNSARIMDLRDRPSLVLAGLLAAAVGLLILALILRRRPLWLAPALIATMPFRVPIDLGGGSANLLLPLYAVIAAGLLAALIGELRGDEVAPEPAADRGWLRYFGPTLAGVMVLYALQAGYADDLTSALQNIAFFLAPFAALFYLLANVRWDGDALRVIVWVLAIEGLLFALLGGYQYLSGDLFWNDKVISGNEAHTYLRVNSLFWDPNILGRYLVVTMTVLAAVVAYGRRARDVYASSILFVIFLALLVISFSQTSSLALFAGLLVLVAARWGLVIGFGAGFATLLALAASIVLVAGGGLSSETDTSGRSGLIDGGLHIAADHPLFGTGSGTFADEFTARYYQGEGFAAESHTEPVTAVAEGGVIGLAAYLVLLTVTFGGLISAAGLSLRERARGTPLAATLLAVYALMFIHSLGYAAFLIDPITWAVLAIATSTLVRPPAAEQRQPA